MAADLILHTVDPFPGHEKVISVAAHHEHLLDETESWPVELEKQDALLEYLTDDFWIEGTDFQLYPGTGGGIMVEHHEGHTDGVWELYDWLSDRATYHRLDIGPFSTIKASLYNDKTYMPGPVVSLSRYLNIGKPVLLTPTVASSIMVALNVTDKSYYREWKRPSPKGKRGTWPGFYAMIGRRVAKRQTVKKFLHDHMGQVVWLTTE